MAAAMKDLVGSTPISIPDANGAQKVVPLSALQYDGKSVSLKAAWETHFDAGEKLAIQKLAEARVAAGELTPPPTPPPRPAVAVKAARSGPETNGIAVTATPDSSMPPLTTTIAFSVTETDTYAGLTGGDAAAHAIGVDAPTGATGDPTAGTGLTLVKQGSTGASAKPAVASTGVLKTATAVDLLDEDSKVVCTIQPRADYAGAGGLSYAVTVDGATFTVSSTYDSSKETGVQAKVTVQTLGSLPDQVAYLVSATAPPGGAAVPKTGAVTLSGGGPDAAANGLIYTP